MNELNERIDAVVISGTFTHEDAQDLPFLLECARRYIAVEHRKRERASNRSVEQYAKVRTEHKARLVTKVNAIVAEAAKYLHAEWSRELLGSTFSLGDGTRVAWADATAEQHADRAQMLEGMAAGDLQTASIHRRAIQDLTACKVSTLGDLDVLAAAA
ncbi:MULTISPECIES: hypothetical protein [unclassified Cryobacterium]|uniref:hypothetical protein n=1 Tax=unclassified Cryobacterium TaxID=2649013 RepID=UPI00106B5495|nr:MULTISPECIES: hypothetical protein [unclassified Cryobacterium]TFB96562.1 hypothetical protein E3O39_10855 [Cryobacterium sp. MDB2-A-1]TFC12846.1 hypothetical protein E3O35_08015 [Cryobacterium sp. MDB2-A-2]